MACPYTDEAEKIRAVHRAITGGKDINPSQWHVHDSSDDTTPIKDLGEARAAAYRMCADAGVEDPDTDPRTKDFLDDIEAGRISITPKRLWAMQKAAQIREGHIVDKAAVEEFSKGKTVCPACRQFSDESHVCPPEQLREFAVKEDTKTAKLYEEAWEIDNKLSQVAETLHRMSGQKFEYVRGGRRWNGTLKEAVAKLQEEIATAESNDSYYLQASSTSLRDAKNTFEKFRALKDERAKVQTKLDEANKTYRKFGWNRAFLTITNGDGHVHSSMDCSTCNKMGKATRFVWLPEYSGGTEENIVDDAGSRACTVCYPSAPVDVLNRETKIFSDEERKQKQDREARLVARSEKAKKAAENSVDGSGEEFTVVYERGVGNSGKTFERTERFKTERSATTWAVDKLSGFYREPNDTEKEAVERIVTAIAGKRGVPVDEVRAEIQKKADAKRKKNDKERARYS